MGWFRRKRANDWTYYATFQFQGEQVQERAGKTKAEALSLAAKRQREVRDGTYNPETKSGTSTVASYAAGWGTKRKNKTADDDRSRLRDHVLPYIGEMRVIDVTPKDVKKWIEDLRAQSKISPSTVHNVYGTASTMFRDAVIDGLIPATPCVIAQGVLPARNRKKKAIYEKADVVKLISDERIPLDRRTFYALTLLTGMRHGEAAGRRWRDYDPNSEPLGCLDIDTQYDDEDLKTPNGEVKPRKAPVHPILAKMLAEWKLSGFARQFGRAPKPDDFIVPSRRGPQHHRTVRRSLSNLTETVEATPKNGRRVSDCERVGITPLTFHRLRDTFISLVRRAGARKDVQQIITHNSKGDQVDQYTNFDWEPLCEVVLCLKLELGGGKLIALPRASGDDRIHVASHDDDVDGSNPQESVDIPKVGSFGVFQVNTAASETRGRVRVPSAPLSSQPNSAVKALESKSRHRKRHSADSEADDEEGFGAAVAEDGERARAAAELRGDGGAP